MNNSISCANYLFCVIYLERVVLFKNPINGFSNYFKVALNCTFCLNISSILFKNPWLIFIETINLIYRLQNIIKPSLNLIIHKLAFLKHQSICVNMGFLSHCPQANQHFVLKDSQANI